MTDQKAQNIKKSNANGVIKANGVINANGVIKNIDEVLPLTALSEDVKTVDFETAISLTGYGKFNILLMLAALPGTMTSIFDTSAMSYVLPSAVCDLNLSNLNKGVLNAITYGGMISSAFMWGFLSDNLGRQKLLIVGYFLDAFCGLVSSFSQSFGVLVVFRFFSGFIISGPHAMLLSYLAEFHGQKYRARMIMLTGIYGALANIFLPGLAWLIIPQPWSWSLFGNKLTYNSWRVFVAMCTLPSLLAGIFMCFYDESPKFLLSQRRYEEAIKVLRKVYTVNTGKHPDTFPLKAESLGSLPKKPSSNSLVLQNPSTTTKKIASVLQSGWIQAKPLFKSPHITNALIVFSIQFGSLLSMNTIRLWMPQLFFIMEDFTKLQEISPANSHLASASLCEMLSYSSTVGQMSVKNITTVDVEETCSVNVVKSTMYLNSVIVGAVTGVFYLFAGSLINAVGRKRILIVGFLIASVCAVSIYWSRNAVVTLTVIAVFLASSSVCGKAIVSVVLDLFPTSLRAMAVSLTMMFGRIGALLGNLMFPILLDLSCIVPFFVVGGIVFCDSVIDNGHPVDFETAISLTGYGKFNILLLLAALPGNMTNIFEVNAMSYILPSAVCDLGLTNFHKGALNGITFGGMIASSFLWGFLSDNFGRQKLLVIGLYMDVICGVLSSFAQSFEILVIFRFFTGFIISGPQAMLLSFLAEFHGKKYRASIIMLSGIFGALANCILPGLAWIIIPKSMEWSLFGGYIKYNSWRLFVALCTVPSFLAGTIIAFFDESPKFLMSRGRNKEALKVLRKVYTVNTGKSKKHYPVKLEALENVSVKTVVEVSPETKVRKKLVHILKAAWDQTSDIFKKPHILNIILVISIHFGSLLGKASIKLWSPQLFFIMEDFQSLEQSSNETLSSFTLCEMINYTETVAKAAAGNTTGVCSVNVVKSTMYLNSIIVGAVTGGLFLFAGSIISTVGRKRILIFCFFFSGVCGLLSYWSRNANLTVGMISLLLAASSVAGKALQTVVVDLFPTSLRTMAVILMMSSGRVGAMIGNMIFPLLLDLFCALPFFTVGGLLIFDSILSFLIPRNLGANTQ